MSSVPKTTPGREHYAFVDTVEEVSATERETTLGVRLDAFAVDRLPQTGIAADRADLDALQPTFLELDLRPANQLADGLGLDVREFEGQWVGLQVGVAGGVPAEQFVSPVQEGARTSVGRMRTLPVEEQSLLGRMGALDTGEFPDATEDQLMAVLSPDRAPPDRVACYRVGQGNLNAVCDSDGRPLLYFDMGGGALANAKTYPAKFRACHRGKPPVVLSHWDTDHWSTASRDPRWERHTWIVPRQAIGISHLRLARRIRAGGTLLVWPAGLGTAFGWFGLLGVCTGSTRNDSGLAMRVDLRGGERVLLPGDADYGVIPTALTEGIHGLIAAHHGARMKSPPPAASAGSGQNLYAAISYGPKNTFKHPRAEARAALRSAGWLTQHLTPSGGVQFVATHPKAPPCSGKDCELRTPKP